MIRFVLEMVNWIFTHLFKSYNNYSIIKIIYLYIVDRKYCPLDQRSCYSVGSLYYVPQSDNIVFAMTMKYVFNLKCYIVVCSYQF